MSRSRRWLVRLIVLAGGSGAVLVGWALLHREWSVERSVEIAAPPEVIHRFVEAPRTWTDWAGWGEPVDRSVRIEHTGPERGVGATMRWHGAVLGDGSLTLVESDPRTGIRIDQAIESDAINAHGWIRYEPLDAQRTRVVWVDRGRVPWWGGFWIARIERGLGHHLQSALDRLRIRAEAATPR